MAKGNLQANFSGSSYLTSSSQSSYSYLQTAQNTSFYFGCLWKTRDKEQLWLKLFWANPIDLKLPMKISFLKWQETTAEIQGKNRLQKEQVFSSQLHKNIGAVDTNSLSAPRSSSYIQRNGLKLI